MERNEDEGGEGAEEVAARVHRLPKEEDPMFWGKACLQALFEESNTVLIQGYSSQGCTENRLHGHVG
jgi:hypothetical protein